MYRVVIIKTLFSCVEYYRSAVGHSLLNSYRLNHWFFFLSVFFNMLRAHYVSISRATATNGIATDSARTQQHIEKAEAEAESLFAYVSTSHQSRIFKSKRPNDWRTFSSLRFAIMRARVQIFPNKLRSLITNLDERMTRTNKKKYR